MYESIQKFNMFRVQEPGVRSSNPTVGQRMEMHRWKDVLLHHLHTLTFLDVVVDRRVLSFIQALLTVSPSLKKIFFHFSKIKADAYAEMSKIKKKISTVPQKVLVSKALFVIPKSPIYSNPTQQIFLAVGIIMV